MIREQLRAAMRAAFPGLDEPKSVLMRVIRQAASRFVLQSISTRDDMPEEPTTAEICPGVPGVTSDPTPGEQVIVVLVGKDAIPYVVGRASEQMPGAVPIEVRHDATTAIRMVSRLDSAGAKVYVGAAPTSALARAADLASLLAALQGLATSLSGSGDPSVVAVGVALNFALLPVSVTPTTKLEAA